MPFNLLAEAWIPVRTADETQSWISPKDLFAAEDAIAPDWPRGDFNTATYEFLIGLVSAVLMPEDEDAWCDIWDHPPDDWAERLAPFSPAFDLDGDGPRFLQEHGGLDGRPTPIEALLIDAPGDQGKKKNSDLLTHRGRYPALGLPAAAIALYALQSFSPSGGRGNRTGLRGGGPLTVLVHPQAPEGEPPEPLWRRIWANVCPVEEPPRDIAEIFAWLRPHRERGKISESSPGFHPLHAFFGMPRRLWLVFGEGRCAITGQEGRVVTGFIQAPYGLDYDLWRHPLTPYRRQKEGAPPYPAKPKSQHFSAGDWVAAVLGNGPLREPAKVVTLARGPDRRDVLSGDGAVDARLLAAGWAMSNMEAIAYLWAEMPLHLASDETRLRALDTLARAMAESANLVATETVRAISSVVDPRRLGASSRDAGLFGTAARDVLDRTNDVFHDILDDALREPSSIDDETFFTGYGSRWREILRRAALDAFNTALPVPVADPAAAKPIIEAHNRLCAVLDGYRKPGPKLFELLGLPVPKRRGPDKGKS